MHKKFSFYNPVKIIYGDNFIDSLKKTVGNEKILLITSEGHNARGVVGKITQNISNIVHICCEIKSYPEFEILNKIYEELKGVKFDLILAVGGGSVIDSAKYLSVSNNNENTTYKFVEDITRKGLAHERYQIKPIIAIPTTAGTGSEITPWASIWDMGERKKYSLCLPDLFPKVAIYDPNLTLTVPKDVTIQTGLDVLSHALESIWNRNSNPISTTFAIASAKTVLEYLPKLKLNSYEYRDKLMTASLNAGLAFSNTKTAIAHAISYYITANYGVPHGIACSFTIPQIINAIKGKYEYVDRALDSIFKNYNVELFFNRLNISTNLNDYLSNKKDILRLVESVSKNERINNSLVSINELIG
jgi:phosphonate metabolism-associated iron-containing alcohol dehydrogenase